jgi:glycerate-2-kinase
MSKTSTRLLFLKKSVKASLKPYLNSFFKKICCDAGKYTKDFCCRNTDLLQNIRIFASGKAAEAMLHGIDDLLIERTEFFAIGPSLPLNPFNNLYGKFVEASHPVPDDRSFDAARYAVKYLQSSTEKKNLLVLISGGTSALLSLGVSPLTDSDKSYIHYRLVHSGLAIEKINSIRRRLSAVKGGNLLTKSLKNHNKVFLLAICDVGSKKFYDIGSGPFSPAPDDTVEAVKAAADIGLDSKFIKIIECSKTLDSDYFKHRFENFSHRYQAFLVFDQILAQKSAMVMLKKDFDDARQIEFNQFYNLIHSPDILQGYRNTWLVTCGEKEIKTTANPGKGGRASHNLLQSAIKLYEAGLQFEFAIFASDGKDGNSGMAGGYINSAIISDQKYKEMKKAVENFSTSEWLNSNGLAFNSFATGTNVGDIHLFLLLNQQ